MTEHNELLRDVFFNQEELHVAEVKNKVDKFLLDSRLSESQQEQLKEWFQYEVSSNIRRKKGSKDSPSPVSKENKRAILNSVLGELRGKVAETLRAEEKEQKERLNPQLETKSGTEALFYRLKSKIHEAPEGRKRYVVLANFDLDDFKRINDDFDHPVGDAVLKAVGKALYESLRPGDKGAHYSGDEFAIILDLEFSDEMTKETVEQKVQEIISRIVKQTQEKAEKYIKADEFIEKMVAKKQETDPGTLIEPKRELSAGFKIVDAEGAETGFSDILVNADAGANTSKILRLVSPENAESDKRIVNHEKIAEIRAGYTAKEWDYAKAKRNLKRELAILFPKLSHEVLMNTVDKILQELEKEQEKLSQ